ncbi:MAG: hypothetical protein HC901_01175 [Bdellovibrionaceae bacterium]|nr:hypothetical protein [Pseudobdellovibrionaceae bacterium]
MLTVWVPKELFPMMDEGVKIEDSDRSKVCAECHPRKAGQDQPNPHPHQGGRMRNIEVAANRLARNARESMRDCALQFRRARNRGDFCWAQKWIAHAKTFRELARGYLEAA